MEMNQNPSKCLMEVTLVMQLIQHLLCIAKIQALCVPFPWGQWRDQVLAVVTN